jgi:multimeric flavodoxin WrbA
LAAKVAVLVKIFDFNPAENWPPTGPVPMLVAMKRLLLIYGGHQGGRIAAMTDAVSAGIREMLNEVELRSMPALQAGIDDLLWAEGLLIGTPEHFGYMSGAVKDFFDRTFYPAEDKTESLPYALYVSAGNDGTGAVSSIERIILGYKWKSIAAPLIVRGEVTEVVHAQCFELGQIMAAGLSAGIF